MLAIVYNGVVELVATHAQLVWRAVGEAAAVVDGGGRVCVGPAVA